MAALTVLVLLVCCLTSASGAGPLVGPGTVGSYQGGGGGRRYGGTVRVQDPPVGIFIAGSSIMEMNGVFGKIESVPGTLDRHTFNLAYKHDYTGWYIALVTASVEIRRAHRTKTEWILIDNDGKDRFHAEGDSLIPGAGNRWSHIHTKSTSTDTPAASRAVALSAEDDEAELPWQVIGIGGEDMLRNIRSHFRYYKHTVQKSIAGADLQKHAFPPGSSQELEPPDHWLAPGALGAAAHGTACRFADGEDSGLQEALAEAKASGNKWSEAVLHRHEAICSRWQQNFSGASLSIHNSLQLFPRYKLALLELGKLHLDQGAYSEAIQAFERVLLLDRQFGGLDVWLVRANAHLARWDSSDAKAKQTLPKTDHCIAWRQTAMCDPWKGPREPASDRSCTETIDVGLSGYCECRHQQSEGVYSRAAESRCGHSVFTCEEECRNAYGHQRPKLAPQHDAACEQVDSPSWCSPNHYLALRVRCDLEEQESSSDAGADADTTQASSGGDELKRAYKKGSLQVHPDKPGGSMRAFQRIAAAYETLSDSAKRRAFDIGDELPRHQRHDGTDGLSYHDEVVKKYFPERFGFEPFGDPHADRKERERYKQRALERQRQDALARDGGPSRASQHSEL
eukprot:TRINITY_DN49173_c0_g1_i1.p1 TRINITY_DN49173_c0_g1~~TRINITY_DN49173_c0_g1_i1.p1  ORF type:complete len:656 (+),score=63.68 TRINITY_DN49173_c0_g1_i1:98-1969(+)